jgi:general secretion pathway protein D
LDRDERKVATAGLLNVASRRGRGRPWLVVVLLLVPSLTSDAQAQEEGAPDGATLETQGSRPGVIRIPSREEREGEGEEREGEGEREGEPQRELERDPERDPAQREPRRTTAEEPTGPPVIRPQRLVGDPEERLPEYFEDTFDPFNPPANLRVRLDFPDAELTDVVMWFSTLTGQNFIIADNVQAGKRITIIGPTPVTIQEAYRAFLAALHMNGLTIVPYGSYLRIVPEDRISQQALPFTAPGTVPRDDRMVTQLVPLDYISASDITALLESMKTDSAIIQVYQPTNTLIITETGTNLRRMLELIERLDQPGGDTRFIYQVRYASAEELRNVLLEIFGEQQQQQQEVRRDDPRERRRRARDEASEPARATEAGAVRVSQIIADARTNQLIIVASPRSYEAIRAMAEALDLPIAGEGQIHVLFLENANAADLASTLQGLTQSVQQAREEEGGQRTRRTRVEEDVEAPAAPSGPTTVTTTFAGQVSITADEPTNALVVVASLRDFLALQRVVALLDRRRQQVYVEAVIMEVTVTNDGQFGLALNAGALPNIGGEDIPIFGATQLGGLSSIILDPTALQGLAVGARGPEVEGTQGLFGPGIGLPSFGAILQALQTDSNVNVLSTPHILTTDNEEAEIIVGENIPFISGGTAGFGNLLGASGGLDIGNLANQFSGLNLGGLGVPSFNVQRESVSLTLRIRPQINESNFVRLELEEIIQDVIAFDELRGPTTSNREARTVVVVQDQQTVVIGGLLEDDITETVEKVPILGDIPVLGYLFRRTTTRVVKRNLLLLLTPYIIRDPSDFREIFRRKMRERQEFLEFFGRESLDYVADIDYSRKNGPLQSIFQTLDEAMRSEEARRRAQGLHDTPQLGPRLDAAPVGGTRLEGEE